MNVLLKSSPIAQAQVLAILRIIIGIFLIYHGQEVFQAKLMQEYAQWDAFKGMNGTLMVYLGKGAELVAGVLLLLGLLTRIGALICVGTFLYITFFIGGGRFWYQDQHPFMFALFGLLFFFTGGGIWSLDSTLFKNN
jgi:putative oxidoreductase